MIHTRYAEAEPALTLDGSEIRELMHPGRHGNRAQSLAEATVAPGAATHLHRHRVSEEIYHVVAGCGRMTLGEASLTLAVGDTVLIPPGTPHCLENTGDEPLRVLCCCSPPYAHADTDLL
jgi:mannose-6-phosphate isomerase-like protein (cupin superfamily)